MISPGGLRDNVTVQLYHSQRIRMILVRWGRRVRLPLNGHLAGLQPSDAEPGYAWHLLDVYR